MSRLLLVPLALFVLLSLAACSTTGSKQGKSTARIYEGDSPNIKFTDRQAAGGPLRPY